MIKIRRLIYPLIFSLLGLLTLIIVSGQQVNAADSQVSLSVQDAVLTADTNAYVVDQTTKSKISNSNTVMDSQAQSYVDTKSVNPSDNLEFNYMFVFKSGEATANMQATISLPKNVTFNKSGSVGKIIYTSDDGSKTTTTDIDSSAVDSDGNLTTKIDDIGTARDYVTARIVLNAVAGSAGKTVKSSHIDYEADNYDNADDTPEFDIKDAPNSIIAATDNDSVQTYADDTFNLTGTMDYKNDDGVVFKNENMYIYTTIDGEGQLPVQDTASSDKNFSLIMKPLAVGTHTITVQIVQNNYNNTEQTIVSNILTYNVTVAANSLIITKDKAFDGDGYTVNDDNPVDIKGTYKHADGSDAHGTTKGLTVNYQITSKADTDKPNVQDAKSATYDDDGTFDFQVDPVVYKMMGTRSPLSEQTFTYEQYTDKYGFNGLEVGKNIITVTLKDEKGHESNPTQFVINVPNVELNISVVSKDIESYNPSSLLGGNYKLPVNISYSDKNYQFSGTTITSFNTLNATQDRIMRMLDDDLVTSMYDNQDVPMQDTLVGSHYGFSNPDNPVISDKAYPAFIYYYDAYGRKSNVEDYNVTFRSRYVDIKTDDNYKFKSFRNYGRKDIQRDGDWGVKVESYKSNWTLKASATTFYQHFGDGRPPVKLAGYMTYVTPTSYGTLTTPMENQQVVLDKYEGSTTSDSVVTTDIASKWTDDTGILLATAGQGLGSSTNSSGFSYTGTYQSTISWEATDSI
ncbi:hypothetical protein [Companilactobacillus tucceti]|uniref:hypothetical protein n=1 Tax=Companilactobacillus tucceti TaxID=238012 RepID=UPI000B1E0A47|nr:hypothetical protein [Companilactobacillus tucceti]